MTPRLSTKTSRPSWAGGARTSTTFAPVVSGFDACALNATEYLIAYRAAANVVTLSRITAATGVVAATVNFASPGDPFTPSIHAIDGVGVVIAAASAGGVNTWVRATTGAMAAIWGPVATSAVPVAFGFGVAIDSSGATATLVGSLVTVTQLFTGCTITDNAGAIVLTNGGHNILPTTRPFWQNTNVFSGVSSVTETPGMSALVAWSDPSSEDNPLLVALLSRQGTTQDAILNSL